MSEQVFLASNGLEVLYQNKPGKYDFKHLIIVFSGFLNAKPGNYDFINALDSCPCDVIWINDSFEGMYSYYLCIDMNFKIEEAINEFISYQIKERALSFNDITLTGFSKGGSAALYYGLKLDINNIVITVPQFYIGNYIHTKWKNVAEHMMGKKYSKAKIQYMNNLIPELLIKDKKLSRNIYILTSEADEQYQTHITPNLIYFDKYKNFNLLKSYSLFVREHGQVTSHHTALLLSIYYALASEAIPRFNDGRVNFFGNQDVVIPKHNSSNLEPYIDIRRIELLGKRIFIDGIALLKGLDAEDYSDISYQLVFKDVNPKHGNDYNIKLAKADRPNLTREMFKDELVIYDKCWVTTPQYKGIDISEVSQGQYELYLNINIKEYEKLVKIIMNKHIIINNKVFSLKLDEQGNCFIVK